MVSRIFIKLLGIKIRKLVIVTLHEAVTNNIMNVTHLIYLARDVAGILSTSVYAQVGQSPPLFDAIRELDQARLASWRAIAALGADTLISVRPSSEWLYSLMTQRSPGVWEPHPIIENASDWSGVFLDSFSWGNLGPITSTHAKIKWLHSPGAGDYNTTETLVEWNELSFFVSKGQPERVKPERH